MPSELIQWFPGHMAKTRRMMKEMLPQVDAVIEILDARIPVSSKNPELHKIVGNKPVLTLFSKSSLADPESISRWKRYYEKEGKSCLFIDSASGAGINEIPDKIRGLLSEKLARYENKGMTGKTLRVMIAGIPNVGKSSLINRLAGGRRAKVEDRPGVTRDKQWITTKYGIELLDTPGVLWPKFEDQTVGENLAVTGAIRDEILDQERMAIILCGRLRKKYPELLSARYKLGDMSQYENMIDYDLFETIGRKRGFLISGGEVNTERTAVMLLDEFRGGKIGRMTLEEP
ncbi:MAG: ribosome biogenesis GTPase YlqF [Ruminococcaceae bacterium]|nr:ribosome biogenesis GTPase YlqF [Oscillospiraceae bacterium]